MTAKVKRIGDAKSKSEANPASAPQVDDSHAGGSKVPEQEIVASDPKYHIYVVQGTYSSAKLRYIGHLRPERISAVLLDLRKTIRSFLACPILLTAAKTEEQTIGAALATIPVEMLDIYGWQRFGDQQYLYQIPFPIWGPKLIRKDPTLVRLPN